MSSGVTSPTEVARRVLGHAETRQAQNAAWAADPAHRTLVRAVARDAAQRGVVSVYDDPALTVRCSDLVLLCRHVLGVPAPVAADPDQPTLFTTGEN